MTETWKEAVLRIVRAQDGEITVQEIYREIEGHPLVTPRLMEIRYDRPYYHHYVRSALDKLNKRGDIRRVGHGRYVRGRKP